MRQVYIGGFPCIIMVSNSTFGGMILRNPSRVRRVPRRTAPHAADSMTPQGQAVWASRNIDNASGFIGPVSRPAPTYTETFLENWDGNSTIPMDVADKLLAEWNGKVVGGVYFKGNTMYLPK